MRSLLTVLVLAAIFGTCIPAAIAMETDQYNLSPVPLADIGDEVSRYIEENFIAAIKEVNDQIAEHNACLSRSPAKGCSSWDDEQKQLTYLRSDAAVAKHVYKRLGYGSLFITNTGKWLNSHKFAHSPDRYKTPYAESVYIFMPIDYATMSPTIRLFGTELGTDKIEHFFQQGYKYYTIRREEIEKGKSEADAEHAAVRWGKHTENTYFGLLVAGVFSNGDMYANYAGMKFYAGLTRPISYGGWSRPPLLALEDGRWVVDPQVNMRDELIRPFISDGLNEALNPSIYAFNVYPTVKRVVTDRSCKEWRTRYPGTTREEIEQRSAALTTWRGEDYGWKKGDRMVPIALCFGPTASQAAR